MKNNNLTVNVCSKVSKQESTSSFDVFFFVVDISLIYYLIFNLCVCWAKKELNENH